MNFHSFKIESVYQQKLLLIIFSLFSVASFAQNPLISSFTPQAAAFGTKVQIDGSNFTGVTSVSFGGVPALSFNLITSTKIEATVGNGATGVVKVVTPAGSSTLAGFKFLAPPIITSFDPLYGQAGTTVTIAGNNFSTIKDSNVVYFGAVKSKVIAASKTAISVTAPASASYQILSVLNKETRLTGYSLKPFIMTFAGGANDTTVIVESKQPSLNLYTGGSSNKVVSGDLDGDGKTDLVVSNLNSPTISVFRNTSTIGKLNSGSFAGKVDLSAGMNTGSLFLSDLNGDGKPEIVAAGSNGLNICLFENQSVPGNLSFKNKIVIADSAGNLAVGDLDADGRPDIADVSNGVVRVRRNLNTGAALSISSFAAPLRIPVNADSRGICIADLDNDGKSDLLVSIITTNAILVMKNQSTPGNIAFGNSISFLVGTGSAALAVGDLDNDNRPDIVVTNSNSNSITVLKNLSSTDSINDFSFAQPLYFTTASGDIDVAIGDIDGDTKPDIAVACYYSDNCSVLKNRSAAGIIAQTSFATRSDFYTKNASNSVCISDIDRDGKPEIIAGNGSDSIVVCLTSVDAPTPPSISSFSPNQAYKYNGVYIYGHGLLGVNSVSFGGVPALYVFALSDSVVYAAVGDGASGAVSLTTEYGTASLNGFKFLQPPLLYSFTPTLAGVGDTVLITGKVFTEVTSVKFGGVPALSFQILSDSTIKAVVGYGGSGEVSAASPFGTGSLGGFTYKPPVIYSFSPLAIGEGETVTIRGAYFTGATSVSFGGTPAQSFNVLSDSVINAVIGQGSTGDVSITTAYGTGTLSGFKFALTPVITSFAPLVAKTGTVVTISGSNFNPNVLDNVVYAGAAKATVIAASDSSLSFIVPPGATNDLITVTANRLTGYSSKPLLPSFIGDGSAFSAGSFSKTSTEVAAAQNSIITADYNLDGKVDLALTKGSNLSVVRNASSLGVPAFVPNGDIPDYNASQLSRGDIDGDGKLDLVDGHNNDLYAAKLYRNISTIDSIYFEPPKLITIPLLGGFTSAIGDLDGDGKPELLTASFWGNTVSVLRNISTAGGIVFADRLDYLFNHNFPSGLLIRDLDGDGKPELVVTYLEAGAPVTIMWNRSTKGNISLTTVLDLPSNMLCKAMIATDVDGDGNTDLAMVNAYGNTLSIYRNMSKVGFLAFSGQLDFPTESNPVGLSAADLNGDGKADIAVANSNTLGTVSVFRNTSKPGLISFDGRINYSTGSLAQGVSAGDLDGDGKADLAICHAGSTFVDEMKNMIDGPVVNVQKDISVTEGNAGTLSSAVFKIVLSKASAIPVTVNFSTVEGKAKAGKDYVDTSGIILFKPGQVAKNLPVTIIGDNLVEANEKFGLQLSLPANATAGILSATCTIKNDDPGLTTSAGDAVNAETKTAGIKLYPNPVKAVLHIEGVDITSKTTVSIIDMKGNVVLKGSLNGNTLNVQQLAAGVYEVKIKTTGKIQSIKFVKE